jgi:hypothetical protein
MGRRQFAAALVAGLALVGILPAPYRAAAADLYVQETAGPCRTVFTGMPTPPYLTRQGCIDNVITVHQLPEHRNRYIVLKQRDVVIEYEPRLIVKVR